MGKFTGCFTFQTVDKLQATIGKGKTPAEIVEALENAGLAFINPATDEIELTDEDVEQMANDFKDKAQ